MRLGLLAERSRRYTMFLIAVVLLILLGLPLLRHAIAGAAVPPKLSASSRSPSTGSSVMENDYNISKHLLIVSHHGSVRTVEIGLYFKTRGWQQVVIPKTTDGVDCNIFDSGSQGLMYAASNNYMRVEFQQGIHPANPAQDRTYNITGNEAKNCSATGAGRQFYGTYNIPPEVVGTTKGDSGYYEVKMIVSFTTGLYNHFMNYKPKILDSERASFVVSIVGGTSAGYTGLIETNKSHLGDPNNSIVGKKSGKNGSFTQYFPFGLSCDAKASKDPQTVTVYDIDNYVGGQIAKPADFYVATMDNSGNLTPLKKSEYTTYKDTGYPFEDEPVVSPRTKVDWTPFPRFIPGDFKNAGGQTSVQITVKPATHYVLVVENIDTNGSAGQNNFIYVGAPGDEIYGATNFKCPEVQKGLDSCNFVNLPADVEANTPFSVGMQGTAGASPDGPGKLSLAIADYNGTADVNSPYSHTFAVSPISEPGLYTLMGTFSYTSGGIPYSASCIAQLSVVRRPYFSVYGGDVSAGQYAMISGCSPAQTASIYAWNKGSGGNYAGAGTQVAAYTTGSINGFATDMLKNGERPSGLAFANKPVPGGSYGGKFDALPTSCDFGTVADANHTSMASGFSTTVDKGQHDFYYVTGNVYIGSGGIHYQQGGWTNPSDIPSFKLVVVGGNIYIDNNAKELDGLYVAMPDGSGKGGTIYTCATGNGTAVAPTNFDFYDTCNHQLTVYGAFVAKRVELGRTYGTLSQASAGESYGGSHAAERFIFTPELWLPVLPGQKANSYDSIQGLPPVL